MRPPSLDEREEPVPADVLTPAPALSKADRCDRCGAQAFVRAVLPGGGDLVFCAHHGKKYYESLRKVAVDFIDETDQINTRPGGSANA